MRKKIVAILAAVFVVFAQFAVLANGANIMKDPGFENSPAELLQPWKGVLWVINGAYPGKAEIVANAERARSGENFLQLFFEKAPDMRNDFMMVFDKFQYPVFVNKKYIMKAWVRGKGELSIGVICYQKDVSEKAMTSPTSLTARSSSNISVHNPDEWKEITYSYIPTDDNHSIRVRINAKGSIEVDDMSLELADLTDVESAQLKELKQRETERKATVKAAPADKPARQPPVLDADDVLNGGFESWIARDDVPSNWDVPGNLLPSGWLIEDRPDEPGRIRRLVNDQSDSSDIFGAYSLLLNARLVAKHIYMPVRDRKVQVSLMAKGHGGNITVRLRHHTGPENKMHVLHVMEIINAATDREWRRYTARAVVPSTSAGPLPAGTSLEIIGHDVAVDNMEVSWSEASRQYKPITYSIPVVAENSVLIDGRFTEQEWGNASGANIGFVNMGGNLVKRQAEYYLGADDKRLLICLRTPMTGTLRQQIKAHDGNVWSDDSYEIHINPTPGLTKPPVAYQFIANANGTIYDARYHDGFRLPTSMEWNCAGIAVASEVADDFWTLEMAIPLAEISLQAGSEFGFNLCKNLKNPYEDSNLTGWGYFDYDKMVHFRLGPELPAVFWGTVGAVGDGNLNLFARISNRGVTARTCKLLFEVDAEQVSISEQRELTAEAAARETVYFNSGGNPGAFGEIGLTVVDATETSELMSHKLNFDRSALLEPTPTGNRILHYPTQKKVGVTLTPGQMAAAGRVDFIVQRRKELVQQTSTAQFETTFDGDGRALVDLALNEGKYLVSAMIIGEDDSCLGYVADDIVVETFDWQDNDIGKGVVNRPFEPLSRDGQTFRCWGREYSFSGSGLPEQIYSQGEAVLTAPMAFVYTPGGTAKYGHQGKFELHSFSEERALFCGETLFDGFKVVASGRLEYDGTLFYDFDLTVDKGVLLSSLHFEISFRQLRYFHAPGLWMSAYPGGGEYIDQSVPVWHPDYLYIPAGVRKHNSLYFPKEDGVIWTSRHMAATKMPGDFLPYMTFGNTRYGLCWFSENARGWCRDSSKPSYEIVRMGETAQVKVNLISATLPPAARTRISFGLAATPVRPKKTGFNYFDYRVMGFGDSSFIEGYGGGLDIKDNYLLDKYIAAVDPHKQKPVFLYVCKSFMALGNPLFRHFYNEWHTVPEESYHSRGTMPTRKYGLNPNDYFAPATCLYPERIDYMISRIEVFIKENPRLRGIYWDENYSVPCLDLTHQNCAYQAYDGTIQPGTHIYGLREVDKRVQAILQKNDRPFPSLLVHTSAMIPPLLAFADINLCAERGTQNLDFIDYWDLPRIENTGAGAWGINIMWLPQWGSNHGGGANTLPNNRSMLAALKLFDFNIWQILCMPQVLQKFRDIENQFGIAENDSRFYGYWQSENQQAVQKLPVFIKSSFFVRPGQKALVYLSNFDKTQQKIPVTFDFSQWNINNFKVLDAESGDEIITNGKTVELNITGHDFRNLLIEHVPAD